MYCFRMVEQIDVMFSYIGVKVSLIYLSYIFINRKNFLLIIIHAYKEITEKENHI